MIRYDEGMHYPGWAATIPVAATVLIVVGCTARSSSASPGPARLLALGPMRHIGRISYSWYLWHWPVLVLPAIALGHSLTFPQATLAVLASYLLAVGSYHLVESPARYAVVLRAPRPAMAMGVTLTVLSLAAATVLARSATNGAEPTGTVDATTEVSGHVFLAAPKVTLNTSTGQVETPSVLTPSALEAADDGGAMNKQDCQSHIPDVVVKDCVFGDRRSNRTVVVFGDSHASAWTAGLEIVATERSWKLVPMSKGNCIPADVTVYHEALGREFRECDAWKDAAFERMKELKPSLIIMGSRWWSKIPGPDGEAVPTEASRRPVADGLAAMARKLTSLGVPVLFLRDWPAPGFDVPTCVAKHLDDYAACSFARAERFPRDSATMEALAQVPGVEVIDITDAMCPPTAVTCPTVDHNILRYRDASHITATYSRALAPLLLEALPTKLPRR